MEDWVCCERQGPSVQQLDRANPHNSSRNALSFVTSCDTGHLTLVAAM